MNMWSDWNLDFEDFPSLLSDANDEFDIELGAPTETLDYILNEHYQQFGTTGYDAISTPRPAPYSSVSTVFSGHSGAEPVESPVFAPLQPPPDPIPKSQAAEPPSTKTLIPPDGKSSAEVPEKQGPRPFTPLELRTDKMAQLNTQLTRHLLSIPDEDDVASLPSTCPEGGKCAIDQTFELSETFIDTLSGISSNIVPRASCASDTTTTAATPSSTSRQDADDRLGKDGDGFLALDDPLCLMVASTYLRFLGVHDKSFRFLLACKRSGRLPPVLNLSIGSFSLAMAPEMRSAFVVNFIESLLTRARGLMNHIIDVSSANDQAANRSSSSCGMGHLPCGEVLGPQAPVSVWSDWGAREAIRTREHALMQLMERARVALS